MTRRPPAKSPQKRPAKPTARPAATPPTPSLEAATPTLVTEPVELAWIAAKAAVAVGVLVGGLLVGLTGMQARALTTFVPGARPLPTLEALSWGDRLRMGALGPVLPRPENIRTPLDLRVDFRTVKLEAADGTALEGWTLPHAQARGEVVLVPGYRASRDSLLPVADRLHGAGWRVTLMDPRGVGGSQGNRSTLGWRESQDLAAFTALARERTLGPVVIYGFSAGAAAALRSVALGQSIAEAVIAEGCFDTMRSALGTRVRRLGAPPFPVVDLLLFWSWFDQEVPGWNHNPVEYAAQVRSPLLVLQGADDWRAPPEGARAIARAAPQGVYAELDGTGHQPGVLTRPLAWERVVEGFLMEAFGPPDTSAPVPTGDDAIPPPPAEAG